MPNPAATIALLSILQRIEPCTGVISHNYSIDCAADQDSYFCFTGSTRAQRHSAAEPCFRSTGTSKKEAVQ